MRRDLELLGVLKTLGDGVPAMTLTLLDNMADGQLPADKLSELAAILRGVATQLDLRAGELEPDTRAHTAGVVTGSLTTG